MCVSSVNVYVKHFLRKTVSKHFLRKTVSKHFLRKSVSNAKTICFTDAKLFNVVLMSKIELLGKNPSENERAVGSGGRLTTMSLHALCVFLCTPLFDC